MINQKDLPSKEKTSHLKQKSDLDFFITTFIISLLMLSGVFLSHHNSDKFLDEIKDPCLFEISSDIINKTIVLTP